MTNSQITFSSSSSLFSPVVAQPAVAREEDKKGEGEKFNLFQSHKLLQAVVSIFSVLFSPSQGESLYFVGFENFGTCVREFALSSYIAGIWRKLFSLSQL